MKRRVEKATGIIGIACFIIIAGLMFLFSAMIGSDDFQEIMSEETDEELAEEGVTEEELSDFIELAEAINYTQDIGLLMVLALAGVAALLLLKNRPVLSALIFSGSAITAAALFWWLILPVVPACLYLTSAIIIFLRGRSKADGNGIDKGR